jgi:steroid delta-isomerase-like uncharacterized protein
MSEITTEMTASEELVLPVLTRRKNGKIDDVVACFAEQFSFKDRGIGLEFKDKQRLAEFFQKTRELFPDSSLQLESIFVGPDHVVCEWTLCATLTEPFYGRLTRTVQVSVYGVSVVRTKGGRIADWTDYYDGLTSRRTPLAAHFTDWVEL